MGLTYLVVIVVSIFGMGLIDSAYSLVIFKNWRTAMKVMIPMWLFFIAWDLAGINLDIFFSGYSQYMTNVYILPELPIEELLFLVLLIYTPLVTFAYLTRNTE